MSYTVSSISLQDINTMPPTVKSMLIGKDTLVPVGVCVSVIALILGMHVWLEAKFVVIDNQMTTIDRKVTEGQMENNFRFRNLENINDLWTRSDMSDHLLQMKQANPNLNIPDSVNYQSRKKKE